MSLFDYGLDVDGVCICLCLFINRYIKKLNGDTIEIDNVNGNFSILDLKQRIEKQCGILVVQQLLIFEASRLDKNDDTLCNCNIRNDCTIHLILLQNNKYT